MCSKRRSKNLAFWFSELDTWVNQGAYSCYWDEFACGLEDIKYLVFGMSTLNGTFEKAETIIRDERRIEKEAYVQLKECYLVGWFRKSEMRDTELEANLVE